MSSVFQRFGKHCSCHPQSECDWDGRIGSLIGLCLALNHAYRRTDRGNANIGYELLRNAPIMVVRTAVHLTAHSHFKQQSTFQMNPYSPHPHPAESRVVPITVGPQMGDTFPYENLFVADRPHLIFL
jgi:hypothetical protein